MRIMGVDFSGARDEKKSATWLAQGRLEGNAFNLETCHPIIRADLTAWLRDLNEPAVVGMDFPFSVPVEFAQFCHRQIPGIFPDGGEMPGLWAAADNTEWQEFLGLREQFMVQHAYLPMRMCDPPTAYSPLQKAPINMVPMTFRGMLLLNGIFAGQTANSVLVLPLAAPRPGVGPYTTTLLEVMPGVTLRRLNLLPAYNGYKGGRYALENRQAILTALPNLVEQRGLNLAGLPYALTQTCRANDDALDAVVAAITAALWSIGVPSRIEPAECPLAPLEGWMYEPRQANQ